MATVQDPNTGAWYDDETGMPASDPSGQPSGLPGTVIGGGPVSFNGMPGSYAGSGDVSFGGLPGTYVGGGSATLDGGPKNFGDIFGSQPSIPGVPAFTYDSFNAPAPFSAPSSQDVLNGDPGYGFRVGQGTQALQQSAAARGVLNTGGTLQDLIDYGQKAASQEYGNAYNRSLGTYQTNYNDALNAWQSNLGAQLAKYNANFGTQVQFPFQAASGQFGVNAGLQGQLFNQQFQTATA